MISAFLERLYLSVGIGREQARLIFLIFIVSIIARAAVLYPGFSIDDYTISYDDIALSYGTYFSQGRFLHAAIVGAVDAMGVNIADIYIACGILALLLYAAFIVSILRFVGVDNVPGAPLVAAIIAVHPYGTEIFTFRMALPGYCAGMLLSIVVLEAIMRHPSRLSARVLAFSASLAMLFTYQIFVNYFLVAIVFGWAFGEIASRDHRAVNRQRTLVLSAVIVSSIIVQLAVMQILSSLGVVSVEARGHLITLDMVPHRLWEMSVTLGRIYWAAESIMPAWLKALLWLLSGLSFLAIARSQWQGVSNHQWLAKTVGLPLLAVVMIPLSLGVIVVLQVWYPTYRIVAHGAVMMGLVWIIGDYYARPSKDLVLGRIQTIGRGLVLVVFVLMSNQIFADQHKLNVWDLMAASRVVARLEALPEFRNIQYVYVSGAGEYPVGLRTAGGSLNVSAYAAPWGRAPLLVAASGYRFRRAIDEREVAGDRYCQTAPTWPDSKSIKVDGDLAIVCFAR